MPDLAAALKRIFRRRWNQGTFTAPSAATEKAASESTATEEPALRLFSPEGNCLNCRNYRPRVTDSPAEVARHGAARASREAIHHAPDDSTRKAAAHHGAGDGDGGAGAVCSIRGFDIGEPLATFCKNFSAPSEPPFGTIYSILSTHGGVALPWLNLERPRVVPATCCICGAASDTGIGLELAEDGVECCGPQHYLDWWTGYQRRRLDYFKLLGERAYSDMYDVISPSAATAYYSDAKEAFYSAISTARDLELRAEQQALETRLAHIKAVFRSQFT